MLEAMELYHATYQAYLPSISEHGLLASPAQRSWSWHGEYGTYSPLGGCVFLANTPELAESFAEAADAVDDETYDSGIAIVSVPVAVLVPELLEVDPFYYTDIEPDAEDPYLAYPEMLHAAECFIYRGDIAPDALSFWILSGFDLVPLKA